MNLQARERLSGVLINLRAGKSRRSFAREIGVSATAVIGWENLSNEPDREHLAKIANMAGYTLDNFVAYLEGKKLQKPSDFGYLKQQITTLKVPEFVELYRLMSDRIAELAIAESVGSK